MQGGAGEPGTLDRPRLTRVLSRALMTLAVSRYFYFYGCYS